MKKGIELDYSVDLFKVALLWMVGLLLCGLMILSIWSFQGFRVGISKYLVGSSDASKREKVADYSTSPLVYLFVTVEDEKLIVISGERQVFEVDAENKDLQEFLKSKVKELQHHHTGSLYMSKKYAAVVSVDRRLRNKEVHKVIDILGQSGFEKIWFERRV